MEDTVIRLGDLPNAQDFVVENSSFFKQGRGTLPTPTEVRSKAAGIDDSRLGTPRPAPLAYEELGLLVKYGQDVTIAEGQCLFFLNKHMKHAVPTPELYGWCEDGEETFLYMELVKGDTLEDRWPTLDLEERQTICEQLRNCVKNWCKLRQEKEPYFVGHLRHKGVGDILFHDAGHPWAGPFDNLTAFHDFFSRFALVFHHEWDPRKEFPELAGLTDDRPVVFTHADLARSNILISPHHEQPPRVAAIIDWHQSGWYPMGWEYLKALVVSDPEDQDWRVNWLSQFLTPPDDAYWLGWEFITSCRGI